MTREEAIAHAQNRLSQTLSKEELVKKIYDDFEAITCEKCKYFNNGACENLKIIHPDTPVYIRYVGCGKWEAKNEHNAYDCKH